MDLARTYKFPFLLRKGRKARNQIIAVAQNSFIPLSP